MESVYIKPSLDILLKQYLKAFLLFSPLILLFFLTDSSRELILILIVIYYVPLTLLFIFELISNHRKTAVELHDEGITLHGKDYYAWDEIYELRVIHKRVKTRTARRGAHTSKINLIRINDTDYNFNHQYLKFTPEEIAEIIIMFQDRISITGIGHTVEDTSQH